MDIGGNDSSVVSFKRIFVVIKMHFNEDILFISSILACFAIKRDFWKELHFAAHISF